MGMSRYYFHIRHGGAFIPDDEGMELKDFQAARAELLASAADLAMAEMRAGRSIGNQTIEIEDAAGRLLDAVPVRHTLH